jgi:branched-chain amino acid transport system ATP-binding protein
VSAPPTTTKETPRLSCAGVTVRFGGLAAVWEADLAVPPATTVGLVGPNGAGKSTLFSVLSGLRRPTSGRVMFEGEDVTHERPQLRAARGLARTFQHPELFTDLTVREHMVLAYRAKHARRRVWSDLVTMGSLRKADPEEDATVDDLVGALGLAPVADRLALGMPLGIARLLELGRALASSPTVLLLDEPSSGLDSTETEQFERTLKRMGDERGISVLLVEHDVDLVMRMCSTIYVLDFGRLIAEGTPAQVRDNPTVRAAYLGEELPTAVPGDDRDDAALVVESRLAPSSEGDPTATTGSGPLLSVRDLAVRYGEATVLGGISFEVRAGSSLAVLGANGAGKSSLARAVSGLVDPAAGQVVFDGEDVTGWPAHRIRRAGLVHLPECRGIFWSLSVMDNLRMAAGSLHGRRVRREAVDHALEVFPVLAERRRQHAGLLSGGEQQMLSMGIALVAFPKMLIADEASLGLAPMMVDLVFEALARAQQAGVTVMMIEQYVHRALDFADECLVLQRGEVAWQGPAADAHQEVLGRYLGEAMTAAD